MIRLTTTFEKFISPALSHPATAQNSFTSNVINHNKNRYPHFVFIMDHDGSSRIQQTRMLDIWNASGTGNFQRGFTCVHNSVNTTTLDVYRQDTAPGGNRAHFLFYE